MGDCILIVSAAAAASASAAAVVVVGAVISWHAKRCGQQDAHVVGQFLASWQPKALGQRQHAACVNSTSDGDSNWTVGDLAYAP